MPAYVAPKYFMLQVFHGVMVSDGRMTRAPWDGAWRAGGQRTGSQRAGGWLSGPAHMERENGSRGGAGRSDGAGCVCEVRRMRVGCAGVTSRAGVRASWSQTDGGGLRARPCPSGRLDASHAVIVFLGKIKLICTKFLHKFL
jgi:hypothetical protein